MHIFKYSVRKGTVAEKLPNQVSPEIKEERSNKLLELSDRNEIEILNSYLGNKVEVLFEEKDEEGYWKGHTSNYLMVKCKTDENLENCIKEVEVKKIEKTNIVAEC